MTGGPEDIVVTMQVYVAPDGTDGAMGADAVNAVKRNLGSLWGSDRYEIDFDKEERLDIPVDETRNRYQLIFTVRRKPQR